MIAQMPNQRCEECGGSLVEPHTLSGLDAAESSDSDGPDYVCIECQRPYSWQGDPPRLEVETP
jgi:hypothetical protein